MSELVPRLAAGDEWWTAQQCAAYCDLKVTAFRKLVHTKSRTRPAPDPELSSPQRWRKSTVVAWHSAPRRQRPKVVAPKGYWTAERCAEAAGITLKAFERAYYARTKTNPLPDAEPSLYLGVRIWRIGPIKAWIDRQAGPRPRRQDPPVVLESGEWTAADCARAAGITQQWWGHLRKNDPDMPEPKRKWVKTRIWDSAEVTEYIARRKARRRLHQAAPAE